MGRNTCSQRPRSMPVLPPQGICHRLQQVLLNMHNPTGHGTPCPGVEELEVEPSPLFLTWGNSAPEMGGGLGSRTCSGPDRCDTAHEPRGHWF